MFNSIQLFQEKGTKHLAEIFTNYTTDLTKIAEMVYGVTNEVTTLGCNIIAEEWESYDELLRNRKDLRRGWHIVRKDETSLLTSLGEVVYHKTLFKNTSTGECRYLLDHLMGIESHARITEDSFARVLGESSESSYRKGGENASIKGDSISREAVMNKIHRLEFPKATAITRKELKTIYIDADEDHVSLQYLEHKGDIRNPRVNTIMPRIVYVYEGVDVSGDGRPMLVNARYFGGVYDGRTQELWGEVLDYLNEAYDMEAVERVYINGDGDNWIRMGERIIPKSRFVLDKYHMSKYIVSATSHLGDSTEDAKDEIYMAIRGQKKGMVSKTFDRIMEVTESDAKRKTVETAKAYIIGNWTGIMQSVKAKGRGVECSAEGHVSHIYSDRMSSRPLGWCRIGVDKMARLRIYRQNKGSMLELVRYQKERIPMASGAEDVVFSASKVIASERANKRALGVYAEMPVYSIPFPQIRKIAALKNHIWDL